jgi:hypothetical protein
LDESEEDAVAITSRPKWLNLPMAGGMADALFPPACPACRGETANGQTLCPACWSETAFLTANGCVTCGREVPGLGSAGANFSCDTPGRGGFRL